VCASVVYLRLARSMKAAVFPADREVRPSATRASLPRSTSSSPSRTTSARWQVPLGRAVSGEVDEPVRDHALAANRQLRPLGRDKSFLLQRAAASTSRTHRVRSSS
jgi:hypothetical protein